MGSYKMASGMDMMLKSMLGIDPEMIKQQVELAGRKAVALEKWAVEQAKATEQAHVRQEHLLLKLLDHIERTERAALVIENNTQHTREIVDSYLLSGVAPAGEARTVDPTLNG
jgi:hypothetical protein